MQEQREKIHSHCRCCQEQPCRDEEVVDVGEEVLRRCGVVGEASSRVRTLPKNLIALLPYRIARGGVSEAYCPVSWCTPEDGMEKIWMAVQCSGTRQSHVFHTLLKKSDLSFIEEEIETNRRELNRKGGS